MKEIRVERMPCTSTPIDLTADEVTILRDWVEAARANGHEPILRSNNSSCGVWLRGRTAERFGLDLPCVAAYQDELGGWAVLGRVDGALLSLQFLDNEVF